MTRELDTAGLTAEEGRRQVTRYLSEAGGLCRVTHLGVEASVWGRGRCQELSAATDVCRYDGSPVRMTRRAIDVSTAPTTRVSFAVPARDGGTLWQDGWLRRLLADDLVLIDLGIPYDHRSNGGTWHAVQSDLGALGVSAAQTRAAAHRLRTSPLHDLVRDHIRALAAATCPGPADSAEHRSALEAVDSATRQLLEALVTSCDPTACAAGRTPASTKEEGP